MNGEYRLFTDRRETAANRGAHSLAMGPSVLSEASADEVIGRLRRIDWAHPALLVYREEGEDRWSQVLLGLNKPEFGEGDGHRDPSFLDGN